jgi:hypothetical protein
VKDCMEISKDEGSRKLTEDSSNSSLSGLD